MKQFLLSDCEMLFSIEVIFSIRLIFLNAKLWT